MKFKKLTIHNIASIEDAVIDFDQAPLSTSEVFLITGRTGSGKTTILDSICLALYGTTPRLKHSSLSSNADSEGTKVTSPLQFMRRGTGESDVELTFVGNNGVNYKVTWHVHRAGRKSNGALQPLKRTLVNEDQNISYNGNEMSAEIVEALGLDFEQFCRTTMLAQGEFTRFLNSKDDAKAEILEKITGMEIYSKIGQKIFEETRKKEVTFKETKLKLEGITVLSDDEVQEHSDRLQQVKGKAHAVEDKKKALEDKRDWLKREQEIKQDLERAQEAVAGAHKLVESDEVRTQEKTVNQWNATIEVRGHLKAEDDARRNLDVERKRWDDMTSDFDLCRGALEHERQLLASMKDESAKLGNELEQTKDKVNAMDNAQTIVGHLNTEIDGRKKIAELNGEQEGLASKLKGELNAKLQSASDAVNQCKSQRDEAKTALDNKSQEVESLGMITLRASKDNRQAELTAVANARTALNTLDDKQKRHKELEDKVAEHRDKISSLQTEKGKLTINVETAKTEMDDCKRIRDKYASTVDEWAKTMRATIQVGDLCPVCGKKIESALPHEDAFAQAYKKFDDDFKVAEVCYNKLNGELNVLSAELAQREKDHQRDSKLLAAAASDVEQAVDSASKQLGQWGIAVNDKSMDALNRVKNDAEAAIESFTGKITAGEKLEQEHKQLSEKYNDAVDKLHKAEKDYTDAKQHIENAQTRLASLDEQMLAKQDEMKTAMEAVAALLQDSGKWDNDYRESPSEFSDEIKRRATRYNQVVRRSDELREQLNTKQGVIYRAQQDVNTLVEQRPQWRELPPAVPRALPAGDSCETLASRLLVDSTAITTKISQLERIQTEAQQQVEAFLNDHSDFSREILLNLANHLTRPMVDDMNRAVNNAKDKLNKAVAQQQHCELQLEKHKETRPDLTPDDTPAVLETAITSMGEEINGFNQVMGEITQILRTDADNKQRQQSLIEEKEAAEKEYLRWSRLDGLLGDATGNKFKKIAQSYVLGVLVGKANYYMRTLTQRYTLQVMPGTFVINIEDAHQGYARRPASTISGGESFLVSLALALALSDLGHRLSVNTLFIDEGFGTLSGEPLTAAIRTLHQLHNTVGRNVGIISHVEELQERIPVQIRVDQEGNSSSSHVTVVS